MKKNTLSLFLLLLTSIVFFSSCVKDKYPPSLTLALEPYVVYYQDTKYTLYDENGDLDVNIPSQVIKLGDVQSYIDTVTSLKYTVDDKGDFWSAESLSEYYKYPGYRVSGYADSKPTVSITYDPEIGVENINGIDLGLATSADNPYFTFTYTATDDGEVTVKKVHLRVYNSYSEMTGLYTSRVSLVPSGSGNSNLWLDKYTDYEGNPNVAGFGYGQGKLVRFATDPSINMKMSVNRFINNKAIKGIIRGDNKVIPESSTGEWVNCEFGSKKGIASSYTQIVKGPMVENDKYINYMMLQDPTLDPKQIETLVIITNNTENNLTTGKIINLEIKDSEGKSLDVPLIAVEYKVARYEHDEDYTGTDSETYDNKKWRPLNLVNQKGDWSNTFRETFIKNVYYSAENQDVINAASLH